MNWHEVKCKFVSFWSCQIERESDVEKREKVWYNEIEQNNDVDLVILQSRSPSCGPKQIYDGTFSGVKVDGQGVFAKLLKEQGFHMIDVEDL